MSLQFSLDNVVSGRVYDNGWKNQEYKLTEEELDQITDVICDGFEDERNEFRENLAILGQDSYNYGIYRRVIKSKHGWELVAGQDYEEDQRAVIDAVINDGFGEPDHDSI